MILKDAEDTIAAIATPLGEGAIGIVRLSGPESIPIVRKFFKAKKDISLQKTQFAEFGKIFDENNKLVDEVICTVFRSPASYTGEDIVEINCHGGIYVTKQILGLCTRSGARLAEPGEFTRRAFLNGKMDLSQAEATADLIKAQSERAHQASLEQLQGKLSADIRHARDQLVESMKLLELELDFAEEDVEFVDKEKVLSQVEKTSRHIHVLLETFNYGRVFREGIKAALVGAPNVGKSSLLNAILGQDRAIVTHIPGTTRDFIEENIIIDGILFKISDTAGIRETLDIVEQEGIRKTKEILGGADISLVIIDSSKELSEAERIFIRHAAAANRENIIIIENKIDLLKNSLQRPVSDMFSGIQVVKTSALTGIGVEDLKTAIANHMRKLTGGASDDSAVVTSRRHQESLQRAKESLDDAVQSLKNSASNEFVAVDLRSALDALGEIVGEVTTEDILHEIFSKFCIGK